MSLLVIDVDHVKLVNDTSGHPAGDELLRRMGELLCEVIRDDDMAVRLGGEEFLILARVDDEQAAELAERVRLAVERELPVTVSVGVHVITPARDDDLPGALWRAVADADKALYAAKRAGRNRVVCSAAIAPS
jgi:diguanylate cyclase (GGDEF)-like protein